MIEEVAASGCRRALACAALIISLRTHQSWTQEGGMSSEDGRKTASRTAPANKLSEDERQAILAVINSMEFGSLPPSQIVPTLVDRGGDLAAESTV
ncbi:hypothetical protein [Actimicrobium antarcticum]|uniref:Uncharacterized protein n=1 Tax=Actimicrobium antarcticum TaxID=1051899 RepID=A0ABP7TSB9_9BURK